MATADKMARQKAAERKARASRVSKAKARDRRVQEVGSSYMRSGSSRGGTKQYGSWKKTTSTRKITTPKRGTRMVGVDSKNRRAINRRTSTRLSKPGARGAEGPKRRSR